MQKENLTEFGSFYLELERHAGFQTTDLIIAGLLDQFDVMEINCLSLLSSRAQVIEESEVQRITGAIAEYAAGRIGYNGRKNPSMMGDGFLLILETALKGTLCSTISRDASSN